MTAVYGFCSSSYYIVISIHTHTNSETWIARNIYYVWERFALSTDFKIGRFHSSSSSSLLSRHKKRECIHSRWCATTLPWLRSLTNARACTLFKFELISMFIKRFSSRLHRGKKVYKIIYCHPCFDFRSFLNVSPNAVALCRISLCLVSFTLSSHATAFLGYTPEHRNVRTTTMSNKKNYKVLN